MQIDHRLQELQNEPKSLQLLAAFSRLYGCGKVALAFQVALTVGVTTAASVISLIHPGFKIWATFIGVTIVWLDVLFVDRIQIHFRKLGAVAQEQLDCHLFGLPWNELRVGKPLEREDMHRAAAKFLKSNNDMKLRDWYPSAVGKVPLSCARIICQRSCFGWDANQRRIYGYWLIGIVVGILLTVAACSLYFAQSLQGFILTAYAPIAPAILWAFREYRRQNDAAESLAKARTFVNGVWKQISKKELTDGELLVISRQIQDALFENRSKNPMLFNWVYGFLRKQHEEDMVNAAGEFVCEVPDMRPANDDASR